MGKLSNYKVEPIAGGCINYVCKRVSRSDVQGGHQQYICIFLVWDIVKIRDFTRFCAESMEYTGHFLWEFYKPVYMGAGNILAGISLFLWKKGAK